MISEYELIVFDWDGTLANSIDWIVDCILQVAIEKNFIAPSESACKGVIGMSLSEAMLTLFPNISKADKTDLVRLYRVRYMSKGITPNDLFLDAVPVLKELQRMGKVLAIATGKGQLGLDRALDGTGVRAFFDELRCAETMASKPNPQMLLDIMDATQISEKKTLMVGDSTLDLMMANKAGVQSVGVTTGAHSRSQLNSQHPMACIDTLTELFREQ